MKWLRDYISAKRQRGETPEELADRELIAREARAAELREFRTDCLNRLQQLNLTAGEREAIHAELRQSYRAEGYSDDPVLNGVVMKRRQES